MTNTIQTVTGSRYSETRELDIKEVAKRIRKDIKAAGYKASVRISRYSMGQSINVEVTALPKNADLASAVVWQGYPCCGTPNTYGMYMGPASIGQDGWFRPVCLTTIEAIVESYNRTSSDRQTDYCNTKFFGFVSVSDELKEAATAAKIAQLAPFMPSAEAEEVEEVEAKSAQAELLEALGVI